MKLQKIAARLILDSDYSVPSEQLFKALNWLPIEKNIEFDQATLLFKSFNNLAPQYMSNMFKYLEEM